MADEASAVDEDEAAATAETAAYQWPRRPGAEAGGPGLPAGGPPVAFAAEPGRPLGPVVPWLIRSFRLAGRIMLPALLVVGMVELATWIPVRLAGPRPPWWTGGALGQFGRVTLVYVAGALVLHLALASQLGLRSGVGRAARRVRARWLPVLAAGAVVGGVAALGSPLLQWGVRTQSGALPFIPIGFTIVRSVVLVPIVFASVAAVAGPGGVNPFASSWRLTSGRYWALAGRQLALLVVASTVGMAAAVAITYAFAPLLDRFDTGVFSLALLTYESAHILVGAALLIVELVATAELYLAAGGAGEI